MTARSACLEKALEALEVGDVELARDLLQDLVRQLPAPPGKKRCPECSFRGWPGEIEAHADREHYWRRAA